MSMGKTFVIIIIVAHTVFTGSCAYTHQSLFFSVSAVRHRHYWWVATHNKNNSNRDKNKSNNIFVRNQYSANSNKLGGTRKIIRSSSLLLFSKSSLSGEFASFSSSSSLPSPARMMQINQNQQQQKEKAHSSFVNNEKSRKREKKEVEIGEKERKEEGSFRIGYVTDVEGNYEYFQAYLARSTVLDYCYCGSSEGTQDDEKERQIELTIQDGCYFVYGGDVIDKGNGDIRICRALVSLKKRHPTRVFLLVGNRDLNKLRLSSELSEYDMSLPIDDIPTPHWDAKAPSLRQYLQSRVATKAVPPPQHSAPIISTTNSNDNNDHEKIEQQQQVMDDAASVNTRVERLKYMLVHTLGCPNTFEHRRDELVILKRNAHNDKSDGSDNNDEITITDDDVVHSFLYEIENVEHGSLRQYLQNANIAVIIGNTIFTHGAIDCDTMKFVPSRASKFENPKRRPKPGKICHDVHEWVSELNHFLHFGLQDYQNRPYWNSKSNIDNTARIDNENNDSNESDSDDGHTTSKPRQLNENERSIRSDSDSSRKPRTTRGGECLMALQNRSAMWGRSIISNCYGDGGVITTTYANDHRNHPDRRRLSEIDPLCYEKVSSDPMDPIVASWLVRHKIRRIVVGHKPTGDCPAILSSYYTGVEVISADTSYSDYNGRSSQGRGSSDSATATAASSVAARKKNKDNHRGKAVSVVEIMGKNPHDNHSEIFGTLHTGKSYCSVLNRLYYSSDLDGDNHINDGSATHLRTEKKKTEKNYLQIDTAVGDSNVGRQIVLPSEGQGTGKEGADTNSIVENGWWIKATTIEKNKSDDDTDDNMYYYHLCRGKGRHVEYKSIPKKQIGSAARERQQESQK